MVSPECRCQPTHLGVPFDAAALNAGWRGSDGKSRFAFSIVPGFCPRFGWRSGLHPKAIDRLRCAADDLAGGVAGTIIVSGGAVHSPDNEAFLMRQWLVDHGVDAGRILVEPCARHTTTNLRNGGRIVLASGAEEAVIVTSDGEWMPGGGHRWRFAEQAYYLGWPWRSSFHARCLVELGYRVGELEWMSPMHIRFVPSPNVFRESWKESRAGDP
jgi:hypothetical protein